MADRVTLAQGLPPDPTPEDIDLAERVHALQFDIAKRLGEGKRVILLTWNKPEVGATDIRSVAVCRAPKDEALTVMQELTFRMLTEAAENQGLDELADELQAELRKARGDRG